MTILSIDTATKICSAALWQDGKVIEHKINNEDGNHARLLPVFIDELLHIARDKNIKIDAVAISEGPGSYTGLRIGAGTAKGLCYGLDVPLIPIYTTEVLCASLIPKYKAFSDSILCPMIDARRMEVYAAYYDSEINPLTDIKAVVVDSVEALLQPIKSYAKKVCFFGDGADKCHGIITEEKTIKCEVISDIVPDARYIGDLAAKLINVRKVVGKALAYYEPFYLKDYIAAPSHVKGLR